jgi:hypothetical protein
MRLVLFIIIVMLISSCKTSEKCDAYSQNEIKKDHQI